MTRSLAPRFVAFVVFATLVGCGPGTSPGRLKVEQVDGQTMLSVAGIGQFYRTLKSVDRARLVSIPDSSTTLILWNEESENIRTEHYAISLDGHRIAGVKTSDPQLKLRYGNFDPLLSQPPTRPQTAPNRGTVFLVQFETQPLPVFLDQLQRLGAKPYRYFPNNAYLVVMSSDVQQKVSGLPYVRWVGPYEWFYRLDESLLPPVLAGARGQSLRVNVQVFERGLAQQSAVAQLIQSVRGTVEQTTGDGLFMEATLDLSQLATVAQADEVLYIDVWTPPESDMDLVRQLGGADYVEAVAGLTGQGVRGEVLDLGVRATHVDFDGTLIPHGSQSVASHGTSTTGIVFGKGLGNPRGRGMLPSGQGISASISGLGDRYQHTARLLTDPYFAVFQSNSWGGGLTTDYTNVSAEMDDILFRTDILITQSQSNTGSQRSRPQAWAKNIVSVGGIRHYESLDLETHCWCRAGSVGPASDGRIKPDLAHFYDRIFTTTSSSDTAYTSSFGGTSAATPITAGHFGLFFQMWHLGLFGNPTGRTVFDSRPHMTTAKAVLINTARQWSFSGTTHDRTRTHQGWGMADVGGLYDKRDILFVVNETDILRPLERKNYSLIVPVRTPELKATLVFKDPSGIPSSTVHRINDLSLHVTSPSGVEYWGNNGLLEGMWSAIGGAEDHNNTVENVFVQFPEAGSWAVEVIASEINEDSHPETNELDADFALVVSGVNRP